MTFVACIIVDEGIVIIADKRRIIDITTGEYIDNKKTKKICKISPMVGLGVSGDYGKFLTLFDEIIERKIFKDKPLTFETATEISISLSKYCYQWLIEGEGREVVSTIFNIAMVIAGYNSDGRPYLRHASTPYFSWLSVKDGYWVIGTMPDVGRYCIKKSYKADMKLQEAINLGLTALNETAHSTVFVGREAQIVTITSTEGYKELQR